MKHHYIYLDFDGVLNDTKYYKTHPMPETPDPHQQFNPKLLENLNEVLRQTNAKIVVDSSWRRHYTVDQLKDILVNAGLDPKYKDDVIDKTPIMGYKGKEIEHSLEKHKDHVDNWLAIDNQVKELKKLHPHNVLKVKGKHGLTKKKAEKAVAKLLNLVHKNTLTVGSIQVEPKLEENKITS